MGLSALLLRCNKRAAARFDANGSLVLLDDQDRARWDRTKDCGGARADRQGDARSPPRALPDPGGRIVRRHTRAAKPTETDWAQDAISYAALEELQPSPVVTLNRAVAVSKARGPEAALAMVEPLGNRLAGLLPFPRAARRAAANARTWPGSTRGFQPGHRAGEFSGGGRAHPHAPRSPDLGERCHDGRRGRKQDRPRCRTPRSTPVLDANGERKGARPG